MSLLVPASPYFLSPCVLGDMGPRLLTSNIAERRRLQREAWLAAKARAQCSEMLVYS